MKYECALAGGGEWLWVLVSGEFTLADGKCLAQAVHAALREHNSRKVLADLRKTAVQFSVLDLYELGEFAAKLLAGALDKAALVVPPESLQPDRFFERVSQNRGLNVRVFTDLDEATQWLQAA